MQYKASRHWQPTDAILYADEVIATQPGCHEKPQPVSYYKFGVHEG